MKHNQQPKEKNFFISYTSKDKDWAIWIAETLEHANYSTFVMAWDIHPGGSFISDMDHAIKDYHKVLLVMSKDYMESDYCKAEWQNKFTQDPIGEKKLIIPIRIDDVNPDGLLSARIYIDLFGLDEAAATEKLQRSYDLCSERPAVFPKKRQRPPL